MNFIIVNYGYPEFYNSKVCLNKINYFCVLRWLAVPPDCEGIFRFETLKTSEPGKWHLIVNIAFISPVIILLIFHLI